MYILLSLHPIARFVWLLLAGGREIQNFSVSFENQCGIEGRVGTRAGETRSLCWSLVNHFLFLSPLTL